ncbi:MAG TPA: SPOR domain-containing protein [Steroidobacteraceae bacterium]|nr:SPOR domain-containing protein [Steroidobacteraceae bacterium]
MIYNRPVRIACLALLFANLVYFAWAHWVDVPPPPPVNLQIARLPQLKLVQLPPSQRPQADAEKMALNQNCLSVGPFDTLDNSAHAAALLKARGFDTRQRAEEGPMTEGYWVYIGGLKTQADTDHALETLERGGIKDALVMPETSEAGRRLSLGVYSERARAERRVQAVGPTGLKAEIADRKLPVSVYWVDLTPPPGISAVPLQDLFAQGVSSRVAVQPCPPPPATTPRAPTAAPPATGTATATSPAAPLHEPATASNPPPPTGGPPNLP